MSSPLEEAKDRCYRYSHSDPRFTQSDQLTYVNLLFSSDIVEEEEEVEEEVEEEEEESEHTPLPPLPPTLPIKVPEIASQGKLSLSRSTRKA